MFLKKTSSFLVQEPHLQIQGWYFRGVDWKHDELYICLGSRMICLASGRFWVHPVSRNNRDQTWWGWATHFQKKTPNPRQVNVAHRIHVWYIYLQLGDVRKYTIHGSYGLWNNICSRVHIWQPMLWIHPMNPTTCCQLLVWWFQPIPRKMNQLRSYRLK